MYFYFSSTELDEMLGRTDWGPETIDVIQKGSQEWSGKIKVFKENDSNKGAHGRRADDENPGQWQQNDIIELQSCNVAGKFAFIYKCISALISLSPPALIRNILLCNYIKIPAMGIRVKAIQTFVPCH